MPEFHRRSPKAGRRAHAKYDAEAAAWRRRNRRFFWSVTVVVAALVLATLLFLAPRDVWAWTGGAVAGMALSFLVVVRDSPPSWIENYRQGGWGEERTAKVLRPLIRQGWVVLHDLPREGDGNIDHVLIGPAGVLVLDSKNWTGEAFVGGSALWTKWPGANRGRANDAVIGAMRAQAADLHSRLTSVGAGRQWVQAVVVLWMEFEQRAARASDVAFVHGDHLVAWLEEQPSRLNAAQIRTLSTQLRPELERRAISSAVPASKTAASS